MMSDLEVTRVVGPTIFLDMTVESVDVSGLLDTGSQSMITSRSLLHAAGRKLHAAGKQLSKLTKPTARLYNKDGQSGKRAKHHCSS